MSIRIMSLIWDSELYEGSTLLTLLALADWANDSGICWPSVPEIARKSRQGERNCQYCIRKLIDDGAIVRKFRTEQPSIFKINLSKFDSTSGAKIAPLRRKATDAKIALPGARACATGVQSTTAGVQPIAPKPSVKATVSEPPNSGSAKTAPQNLFPANGNKQPLSQSERDSWDLRRWREEMNRLAPQEGVYVQDKDSEWLNRARISAYNSGVTLDRIQEILGKFFPDDPVIQKLDPNKQLPFTGTSP